jgi:uncharacterized ferredoxin-like protein
MLKMMRRNVLIDTGGLQGPFGLDKIICPDIYKRKQVMGTIVGVGPKCRMFSDADLGRKVIFRAQHAYDLEISDKVAPRYGLAATFHLIAFEEDVTAML